jgi:predicted HicB family RNase H-like nuclease
LRSWERGFTFAAGWVYDAAMEEIRIRVEAPLKKSLQAAADKNKRSLNSEIAFRLEASVKSK